MFFICGRLLLDYFSSVFPSMGAAMLPAQACAKWPPWRLLRARDGSRRIPNITVVFHDGCFSKGVAARYLVRKPCCGHLFPSKLPPKAQRSHVTRVCSTILLTFSLVEASGVGLRRGALRRPTARGRHWAPHPALTASCRVLTAPAQHVLNAGCTGKT